MTIPGAPNLFPAVLAEGEYAGNAFQLHYKLDGCGYVIRAMISDGTIILAARCCH